MKSFIYIFTYLLAIILLIRPISVNSEEVILSFDERGRATGNRRNIPVAINVYAKDGTVPQVVHEVGDYAGIPYDILRVDPSEDTFLQVDYLGSPMPMTELYDHDLVNEGYHRIGGINASYFANGSDMYGLPAGTIRIDNEFQYWNDIELSPSYGNGYASVYFNNTDATIKYHGWVGPEWIPYDDNIWRGEQTGMHHYGIDSKFAFSGSYTFFVDGQQTDITNGTENVIDYRGYSRAFSVFAQRSDKQYLLISFFGTISDANVIEFLRYEDVIDAIRLDGGGSTHFLYDDELVNLPYIKSDYSEVIDDSPLFGYHELEKGYQELPVDNRQEIEIKLSNETDLLFTDTIKQGDTISIINFDKEYLIDHMTVENNIDLTLLPTSSTNLIESSNQETYYYDSQNNGTILKLLKTGTMKDHVYLAFFDNVIPKKDIYTLDIVADTLPLYHKEDTELTTIEVYNYQDKLIQTENIDMNKTFYLYVEAYPKHIFENWDIQENKNTITIKPVYREFTFMENVESFFSNLFH